MLLDVAQCCAHYVMKHFEVGGLGMCEFKQIFLETEGTKDGALQAAHKVMSGNHCLS
jgi:hypothetical protein